MSTPYRTPSIKPPCATCGGDQLVCCACGLSGAKCKCPERNLPTPRACPECLPEYTDLEMVKAQAQLVLERTRT